MADSCAAKRILASQNCHNIRMKSARHLEFELPDDLVIGGSDDEDARMGAGSTLPQELFALGSPDRTSPAFEATRPGASRSLAESDTLPAALAPAPKISATAAPATATVLDALVNPQNRLAHDGPQPKRVLVVDDDLTMRLYMRSRLMLRGYVQITEAASGEEAMEFVHQQRFDAVLLDVDMGSKNGFETCRAVRSHVRREGSKQPQIYIITSRSGVIDKMRAKMAGADAFLSKPPHPGELAAMLEKL